MLNFMAVYFTLGVFTATFTIDIFWKIRKLNQITLILPRPGGGADNANFTFLHEKLPQFVVYFIQNNTNLTPPQTLGNYAQMHPQ